MRILFIPFLFLLFLLPSANTQAKIIHIPADSSTIQAGINGASDGDTVLVARGHYYERINFYGKTIFVASNFVFDNDTTTIDSTIIDADTSVLGVSDTGSAVVFVSSEDSNSVIEGFTIQNGIGTANPWSYRLGGGICCVSSSPTIRNNAITSNSGTFGGGIFCDYSSLVIGNNTITGNFVSENGGGVYCTHSSPSIRQNVIGGNSAARDGGGIKCGYYSSPTVHNNIIIGNFAAGQPGGGGGAGGIYIDSYCEPTVTDNTITGNSTNYYGGGIYCHYASPLITENTITGNSAGGGGGICSHLPNSSSISNNTISGNSAIGTGGGIYLIDSTPDVRNNTITGNSARDGGGIRCSDSSPLIINNTIAGNSATERGGGIGCAGYSSPTVRNNIISNSLDGEGISCEEESYPTIYHNDVWNNADGNFYNCPAGVGDTTWGTNFNGTPCDSFYNIIRDPLFADTINFELLCNSPCIDAGDPNYYVPIDSGGCRIDMGTHEYPYILGDANSDGAITPKGSGIGGVNVGDIVFIVNYLFLNGPPSCPYHAADTNCDGLVDIGDIICLINYLFLEGPLPCGF